VLAAGLAGLAAAVLVAGLTRRPGPGLSPDGMSYLGAAKTLAAGRAPRVPFAEWSSPDSTARLRDYPPLFPAATALGIRLGASPEQAARAVEVVAATASVGGGTWIVASAAGPVAGVLAGAAILIAPPFVEDHYVLLSEPLFLAVLVALVAAFLRPVKPLAAGLIAGAGVMVRYAGLCLPAAAGLWYFARAGSVRARLRDGLLASAPGALLFLGWSRWAGGAREYGWYGGFGRTLREGWTTLQAFVVPAVPASPARAAATVALGLAAGALLVRRARRAAPAVRTLLAACALAGATYVGIVVFSRLFADGAVPFDNRLCSPLFLLATIGLAAAAADAWRGWPAALRAGAAGLALAWLLGSGWVVLGEARELADDGWGYASADWIASPLRAWLRTSGPRYALYSDNAPSLYSMVPRPSRMVPEDTAAATTDSLAAVLASRPSALIAFADAYTPELPRAAWFARHYGWRVVLTCDEGTVWVARDAAEAAPTTAQPGASRGQDVVRRGALPRRPEPRAR